MDDLKMDSPLVDLKHSVSVLFAADTTPLFSRNLMVEEALESLLIWAVGTDMVWVVEM
jgi:hypothetical protein